MKTGVFDNLKTQRREAWLDGGKVGDWPASACADPAAKARGWEKEALREPFGEHTPVRKLLQSDIDEMPFGDGMEYQHALIFEAFATAQEAATWFEARGCEIFFSTETCSMRKSRGGSA